MKSAIKVFTAILLTLIFFSCSGGKNNLESDAKKFIENDVTATSQGYLKLASFNKVDGVSKSNNGAESYEMTFTIEIECVKDGGYVNIMRNGKLGGFAILLPQQIDNYSGQFEQPAKVGNRYNMEGIILFEKHDSGWVVLGWQSKN